MKLNIKFIWFSVVVLGGSLASYLIFSFEQNEKTLIDQGQSTIHWIQNSLAEKLAGNKLRARRMAYLKSLPEKYYALEKKIQFAVSEKTDKLGLKINEEGGSQYTDTIMLNNKAYFFTLPLESLMSDIVREDFFDAIALIDHKHLYYQSKKRMLNEVMNDTLIAAYYQNDLGVYHTRVLVTGEKYEAFIRPVQFHQQDFLLIGLMKTSSFDKAKRQVPFSALNVVFLILILIISSIPIIRVFSLASGDQLGKSLVLECGLSIVLLATVLGLAVSYVSNTIILRSDHMDDIFTALNKEDSLGHITSNEIESFFNDKQDILDSLIRLNEPVGVPSKLNEYLTMDADNGRVMLFAFDNVSLSEDFLPEGVIVARKRHYFKVHHKQYGTTKSIADNGYYLGAHYSYASDQFEGVISKRERDTVYVITFPLNAIDRIISKAQAKGIYYMLIDYKGDMLYHQGDIKRVISLRDELGTNSRLMVLLHGNPKVTRTMDFKFRGTDYTGYIRPMSIYKHGSKYLYYMLIYSDVNQPLILESAATGDAIVLISLCVILVVILALLMTAGTYRSQRLSFSKFSYDWFMPSVRNYNQLRVLNGFLLLQCTFLLFMSIIFYADIFFIFFFILESIAFIGLYRYLLLNKGKVLSHEFNYLFVVGAAIILAISWGLIIYYSVRTEHSLGKGFYKGFVFLAIFFRVIIYKVRFFKDVEKDKISVRMAVRQFNRSLMLWVAAIAFLPAILLYNASLNLEKRVWDELAIKEAKNRKFDEKHLESGIEGSNTHNHNETNSKNEKIENGENVLKDSKRHAFYELIRLLPNYMKVDDKRVKSHQFRYVSLDILQSALSDQWKPKPWMQLVGFASGALLFLILMYYIVKGAINRIYFVTMVRVKSELRGKDLENYLERYDTIDFQRLIVVGLPFSGRSSQIMPWISQQGDPIMTFDLASELQLDALEEYCKLEEYRMGDNVPNIQKIMDVKYGKNHDENSQDQNSVCVILKNFNALLLDLDRLASFLKSLEFLVSHDSIKIIIYSNSTANEIIEMLRDNNSLLNRYPRNHPVDIELYVDKIEYLMASFITHIFRLSGQKDLNVGKYMARELKYNRNMQSAILYAQDMDKIVNECPSEHFTKLMNKLPFIDTVTIENNAFEQYVIQMQSFNKGYYLAIWNALTIREKHVVYDLATNGFANYANKDKINRLIRKGLVKVSVKANRIRLMNSSFRNFVLTSISKQEVDSFKKIASKEGNWQSVRILLGAVVLGILVFIYFADPSVMSKTVGVLGSVLAAVGILAKTFMQVSSGSWFSKKSSDEG